MEVSVERQDMALLGHQLGFSERLFLTRQHGEKAYELLREKLQTLDEGLGLILSFPSGQIIDASFADETIIRLGEEISASNSDQHCILLENLTEDSLTNIEAIIKLRQIKLAFLVVKPHGVWQCIGNVESSLHETLDIISRHKYLTAPELSKILGLAINTASNRLKRLYDMRLIRREQQVSSQGIQYIYYFWQWSN
jgi:predicted transcriptional regulator